MGSMVAWSQSDLCLRAGITLWSCSNLVSYAHNSLKIQGQNLHIVHYMASHVLWVAMMIEYQWTQYLLYLVSWYSHLTFFLQLAATSWRVVCHAGRLQNGRYSSVSVKPSAYQGNQSTQIYRLISEIILYINTWPKTNPKHWLLEIVQNRILLTNTCSTKTQYSICSCLVWSDVNVLWGQSKGSNGQGNE